MDAAIHGCRLPFTQSGQSGLPIADSYPHLQTCADDLAIVRSCHHDSFNHSPAQYMMNTGSARMGHPCLGSWTAYGLGSASENLPAFVVMATTGNVKGGPPTYGRGFLPGTYQPTVLRHSGSPVLYLDPPKELAHANQREMLNFVQWLNENHARERGDDTDDLSARIAAYELAYRMQAAVPEAVDLRQESQATRDLYGVDDPIAGTYARSCLMARRLVERGVRFVQIYSGGEENERSWDGHTNIAANHRQFAGETDQPIGALLTDLKQRGLLNETLVIWGGEFGRTPMAQGTGRDHHIKGFSIWLAGGGIKGGVVHGATDELGFHAVENRHYVTDIHATLMYQLGLDSHRLVVPGRQRLAIDHGLPIREIIA